MAILIVRNNTNKKALDASLLLETYLASQSIQTHLVNPYELNCSVGLADFGVDDPNSVELAVVLGGDGAILGTAQLVSGTTIPILGINFGRLGFLANSGDEGIVALVAAALSGDVVRERRTNLRVDVLHEGESIDAIDLGCERVRARDGRSYFAFNEVALVRGPTGRIIDFSLSIAGSPLTDMRGDGLIVASATGSTAYALSAGGPLVAPEYDGLVVVPLAPHTLKARPLVTSRNDIVEIDFPDADPHREPSLFTDGDRLTFAETVTKVIVRTGSEPTTLLRYKGEGFYARAAKVFF